MGKEYKDKDKKDKQEKPQYSIRTVNLKLVPTKEQAELLDKEFESFNKLHDIAVNMYINLENPNTDNINEAARIMRKELKSRDCSGTFVDLAVGKRGAESYFRLLRKMAKKDMLFRDGQIKKIEIENPNLVKLKSVWFNEVKNMSGQCTMCGREGKICYKSNEKEYDDERLCEVCAVDFFKYQSILKSIKRHVIKNYFLCKEVASKHKLSKGFLNNIAKFDKPIDYLTGTTSNKVKIKKGQLKMDFETKMATITLRSGKDKMKVGFLGHYYYRQLPRYGMCSDENKYNKLIIDFLNGGGYPFLIKRNKIKSGKIEVEYYLSFPTHYPMSDKDLKIEGCILVSQRRVLIYANGRAEFVELYNPYLQKREYGEKNRRIQERNDNLCICDWNMIPRKNRMLITSLRDKLGFDWVKDREVTVTKSEDGNKVVIKDDNNDKRMIHIDINRELGTAKLTHYDKDGRPLPIKLYVTERKKTLEDIKLEHNKIHDKGNKEGNNKIHDKGNKEGNNKIHDKGNKEGNNKEDNKINEKNDKHRRIDLYIKRKIPMPKKYSDGNLLKHIVHRNKEVARNIVEKTKSLLSDEGGVLLVDYTYMHPVKEGIVPMVALNSRIKSMLGYDSIYAGSIYWGKLKSLTCPHCHKVQPEKGEDGRLIIRDIFLSKITSWICEEDNCNDKINNPLIGVARYVMNSNIEELLKSPVKKEKDNIEEDATPNYHSANSNIK